MNDHFSGFSSQRKPRFALLKRRWSTGTHAQIRSLDAGNEGSALIEMALVLPVMMLLITGVCSLGVTLNNYLVLTNAVQTGAMQAAITAGETSVDPCKIAATAMAAASPTLTPANITYSFNFNGTKAGPFTGTTASTCATDNSDLTYGSTITVTATYPTQLVIYGWKPSALTLTASTAEIAQ